MINKYIILFVVLICCLFVNASNQEIEARGKKKKIALLGEFFTQLCNEKEVIVFILRRKRSVVIDF